MREIYMEVCKGLWEHHNIPSSPPSLESSLVGVAGAFIFLIFDSLWVSFWKNFFWWSQRCKYSKQNTTVLVVTVAFATAPENYATTNDISCHAALAHVRTDKPLLCSVCLGGGVGLSPATSTAVSDYDNSHTTLHKRLCGATFIIPDSLWLSTVATFPHHPLSFSCLPFSPSLGFFLSFLSLG